MPATEGRWPIARRALAALGLRRRAARRSSPAIGDDRAESHVVLQQLTRIRTSEGSESVHGTLLAEFAAGQRDATLYVAFCPPLERLPEIEAHVADDTDASVNVAQRLHQGARFDVRVANPAAEPCRVSIEFCANI